MFLKGSRYETARPFVSERGEPTFSGVRARFIAPATPVIEHTVQAGDRLDRLARHYYGNDRLWWRIVDANVDVFNGADLLRETEDALPIASSTLVLDGMIGRAILIPRARD